MLNDIANEDRDYADTVKVMMGDPAGAAAVPEEKQASRGFISGLLGRFFR